MAFFPQCFPVKSESVSCSVVAILSFPHGSDSKKSARNAGDLGSIPGLGRSLGGGHGNTFQYSCLENPHGQKSLVGYSPWGHKESDTTEQLSTAQNRDGRILSLRLEQSSEVHCCTRR